MTNLSIARPYAKAVFELACDNKQVQEWGHFLQYAALIVQDAKVKELLTSPKLNAADRIKLIQNCFEQTLTAEFANFLQLLADYNRLKLLPEIATLFEIMQKEQDKTVAVEITSAFPISNAQKEKLLQALKIRLQREVSAQFNQDSNLIGGTIIRAGDFVIDGSVRSKLDRMKNLLED